MLLLLMEIAENEKKTTQKVNQLRNEVKEYISELEEEIGDLKQKNG